jgi:hypothetical protein
VKGLGAPKAGGLGGEGKLRVGAVASNHISPLPSGLSADAPAAPCVFKFKRRCFADVDLYVVAILQEALRAVHYCYRGQTIAEKAGAHAAQPNYLPTTTTVHG